MQPIIYSTENLFFFVYCAKPHITRQPHGNRYFNVSRRSKQALFKSFMSFHTQSLPRFREDRLTPTVEKRLQRSFNQKPSIASIIKPPLRKGTSKLTNLADTRRIGCFHPVCVNECRATCRQVKLCYAPRRISISLLGRHLPGARTSASKRAHVYIVCGASRAYLWRSVLRLYPGPQLPRCPICSIAGFEAPGYRFAFLQTRGEHVNVYLSRTVRGRVASHACIIKHFSGF